MPDQAVSKMRLLKAGLSLAKTHVLAPGSVTLKKVTLANLKCMQLNPFDIKPLPSCPAISPLRFTIGKHSESGFNIDLRLFHLLRC